MFVDRGIATRTFFLPCLHVRLYTQSKAKILSSRTFIQSFLRSMTGEREGGKTCVSIYLLSI